MSVESVSLNRSFVRAPLRLLASVLSLPYLLLRGSTAVAAVASGLMQTFVFAHVLDPHRFSIFIIIGALGVSLWLFDLGAAKILYVRQRAAFLKRDDSMSVPQQSTAVIAVYAAMVLVATGGCFALMAMQESVPTIDAAHYALFLSFSALNLVWYPLRNISSAIDEYFRFEALEAVRRLGHMGLMLTMLIGLSLTDFLLLANLLWFVLIGAAFSRLSERRALSRRIDTVWTGLTTFWRENRRDILSGGSYALADFAIYNFPYVAVPVLFGLGAPTIILDTLFKVFRGLSLLYGPGLDPLVPQQTRAFAGGDRAMLGKATATSAVLCALPTLALCVALLVAGDTLFALLLGQSASIPLAAILLLIGLLIANLTQSVASNLLLHTGFFRQIARVASYTCLAMAVMTAAVFAAGLSFVAFIAGYTAVYAGAAACYVLLMARGPLRAGAIRPSTI